MTFPNSLQNTNSHKPQTGSPSQGRQSDKSKNTKLSWFLSTASRNGTEYVDSLLPRITVEVH